MHFKPSTWVSILQFSLLSLGCMPASLAEHYKFWHLGPNARDADIPGWGWTRVYKPPGDPNVPPAQREGQWRTACSLSHPPLFPFLCLLVWLWNPILLVTTTDFTYCPQAQRGQVTSNRPYGFLETGEWILHLWMTFGLWSPFSSTAWGL